MKPLRSLLPIPVVGECRIDQLFDYADAVLDPEAAALRWTVVLEVRRTADRTPNALRWFALVSIGVRRRQLFSLLNAALQREMTTPRLEAEREKGTLNDLFQAMTLSNAFVWLVPLHELGGTVVFVRKPGDDPSLKKMLQFNRTSQNLTDSGSNDEYHARSE